MKTERKSSPRLKNYDYKLSGDYFITICTHKKGCLFGSINNDQIDLSDYGMIASLSWLELPDHYAEIQLDEFIFMPNHMHAIVILSSAQNNHSLSEIIRGYKTWSARKINQHRNLTKAPVWQRSFYDHIIRDDNDLLRIQQYIQNNPQKWALDQENPINHK